MPFTERTTTRSCTPESIPCRRTDFVQNTNYGINKMARYLGLFGWFWTSTRWRGCLRDGRSFLAKSPSEQREFCSHSLGSHSHKSLRAQELNSSQLDSALHSISSPTVTQASQRWPARNTRLQLKSTWSSVGTTTASTPPFRAFTSTMTPPRWPPTTTPTLCTSSR